MKTINIDLDLITYIKDNILPQYSNFDKAHRQNHIKKVINQSMDLAEYYDVNKNMVYTIAAYHDLGISEGREFHHISSGEMLYNDHILRKWFSEEQLIIMKEAVEDHRASSKHAPRTIYGKIVAEADRSIESITIIRRTIQYGLKNYPTLNKEEQYERLLKHLKNKYDYNGYLKLWLPESSNATKLEELRKLIADKNKLHDIFLSLWETENINS